MESIELKVIFLSQFLNQSLWWKLDPSRIKEQMEQKFYKNETYISGFGL